MLHSDGEEGGVLVGILKKKTTLFPSLFDHLLEECFVVIITATRDKIDGYAGGYCGVVMFINHKPLFIVLCTVYMNVFFFF